MNPPSLLSAQYKKQALSLKNPRNPALLSSFNRKSTFNKLKWFTQSGGSDPQASLALLKAHAQSRLTKQPTPSFTTMTQTYTLQEQSIQKTLHSLNDSQQEFLMADDLTNSFLEAEAQCSDYPQSLSLQLSNNPFGKKILKTKDPQKTYSITPPILTNSSKKDKNMCTEKCSSFIDTSALMPQQQQGLFFVQPICGKQSSPETRVQTATETKSFNKLNNLEQMSEEDIESDIGDEQADFTCKYPHLYNPSSQFDSRITRLTAPCMEALHQRRLPYNDCVETHESSEIEVFNIQRLSSLGGRATSTNEIVSQHSLNGDLNEIQIFVNYLPFENTEQTIKETDQDHYQNRIHSKNQSERRITTLASVRTNSLLCNVKMTEKLPQKADSILTDSINAPNSFNLPYSSDSVSEKLRECFSPHSQYEHASPISLQNRLSPNPHHCLTSRVYCDVDGSISPYLSKQLGQGQSTLNYDKTSQNQQAIMSPNKFFQINKHPLPQMFSNRQLQFHSQYEIENMRLRSENQCLRRQLNFLLRCKPI